MNAGVAETDLHTLAAADLAEKAQSEPFQIGDWVVDPQLNQIQHQHSSESRHLEPRLAKLLCHLAAHQGKVVERDTLVALLWPRVIVNENSLTRAVSELRKQLTVSAETRINYIETIPKRGYRLVVPVIVPMTEPVTARVSAAQPTVTLNADHREASTAVSAPGYLQSIHNLQKSAPAAFALTLVLTFLLHLDSLSRQPEPASFRDEIISTADRSEIGGKVVLSDANSDDKLGAEIDKVLLSRDESRFAYVQYDHTGSTIMLGDMGALETAEVISEGDNDYKPAALFNSKDILFNLAWSPIGDALLFASKPAMTTTAWFDPKLKPVAKLYSLDLDTLEVSLLVEQSPAEMDPTSSEMSLT